MAEEGKMAYVIPAKRKSAENGQAGRAHCDKKHIATGGPCDNGPEVHTAVPASLEGVTEKNVRKAAAPPGISRRGTGKPDGQVPPTRVAAHGSNGIDQMQSTRSINQDDTEESPVVSPHFALDLEHISTLSWHEVGLAAEEEETSLFGRFRHLTALGLVHESEAEKMSAIGNYFAAVWMATRQDGTASLPHFLRGKADDDEWRWSDLQFEAEDRDDSIAGATRVLIGLGVLGEDFEVELRGLGMVFARRWMLASSVPDVDRGVWGFCGG